MNYFKTTCYFFIILISCRHVPESDQNDNDNNSWAILFDGSNTFHWRGFHMDHFPDSGWYVSENILINDGSGSGGLISMDQYSNFILEWEWCLYDEGGNSGLKYFVKERPDKKGKYAFGLEYQLLDDQNFEWMKDGRMTNNDYHSAGALYEFFAPSSDKKLMPIGQFNKSKLVVRGKNVEHWLNGLKVLSYVRGGEKFNEMKGKSKFKDVSEYGLHEKGHILLQDHQSKVGFKNIRIKITNPDI
jgi:hypothetical protein